MATTRRGRGLRGDERVAILFLLPWILGLVFLVVIPFAWGIWISLTDEQIVKVGEFVGLANYEEILTDDPLFIQALGVTLRWLLLTTPLFMISGLALALLLNQRLPGMHIFRTILFVPTVLSGVAVAVLWVVLLNGDLGAVNQILRAVGIDDPPNWLRDPGWAMPAVAIMSIWGIGGSAIIWLAGLQNIPPHLYEAASIDGAGEIAKFRNVTIPMLSATVFFVLINLLVDSLLVFAPVFIASGGTQTGGPANSLLFLMYYVYRKALIEGDLAYGAALAWILTLIGAVVVWAAFRFERRVYYQAGRE
ncbi:MAG TPA: sugar ABC transporter permease [Candidatus Saccharimonadales bacterium]|nr:sugar ABC transporter permease [Candidatus Saccharimonadales bacterium]